MPNISILSGVLTSEILELNYMKSYSYITKISNYPYSPKKVHFGSLIFLVNLIFRPENALAERAVQNNQSIRTNKTGR